jgi:AmmeMemoRadiSam system protein B
MVEAYLNRVPPLSLQGDLLGIISPHAGLVYSGQVAAYAYSLVRGKPISRVLILGPDHRTAFPGVLATEKAYYQTPLGLVPVDTRVLQDLAQRIPMAFIRTDMEHSLEMQLPFLQVVLRSFSIIPIMLGSQTLSTVVRLVSALAEVLEPRSAFIVASSDLSHYYDSATALAMDRVIMALIEEYLPEALIEKVEKGDTEACGYGAIAAAMLLAKGWGATRAQILVRSDSGAVSGDHLKVVGYLAAAILKT